MYSYIDDIYTYIEQLLTNYIDLYIINNDTYIDRYNIHYIDKVIDKESHTYMNTTLSIYD